MVRGQMSWLEAEGPPTGSRQAVSVQAGRWSGREARAQVVLTCPEVAPGPRGRAGGGAIQLARSTVRQGSRAIDSVPKEGSSVGVCMSLGK